MANPGKNIFTILCESSVVDSQSNNASLINVFERFTISPEHEEGMIGQKCTLVSLWQKGDSETADLKFEFRNPSGELTLEINQVSIEFKAARHRVNVAMTALPVSEAGQYEFLAYIKDGDDWKEAGQYPIEVVKAEL